MSYVTIQDYMRTELNLSGNELITYAIICGFSQDKESMYFGSQQYLADWCGISIRQVQRILDSLIEKKLITRVEQYDKGNKKCYYYVNDIHDVMGDKMSCVDDKMSLNNIDNNTISNNKLLDIQAGKPKKNMYEHCIDYIEERNYSKEEKDKLIDYLNYMLARKDSKKLKSHYQWKSLLEKLDEMNGNKVDIVNQSILRGWATFVEIKSYSSSKKSTDLNPNNNIGSTNF